MRISDFLCVVLWKINYFITDGLTNILCVLSSKLFVYIISPKRHPCVITPKDVFFIS